MSVSFGKQKGYLFLLFSAAYFALYIFPNFRPPFQPVYLPLLRIDSEVPLVPWTFLIYISLYLLELLAIFLHREPEPFRSFARMAFATLFICGSFFVFFPTEYPRPPYPEVSNRVVSFIMNLVGHADMPTNCFPSMHVAITGIATWSLRHKGPRVFWTFALWSLAIFISTLTTKQHYFVDILGGLTVVVTVALLDWALFQREFMPPVHAAFPPE